MVPGQSRRLWIYRGNADLCDHTFACHFPTHQVLDDIDPSCLFSISRTLHIQSKPFFQLAGKAGERTISS